MDSSGKKSKTHRRKTVHTPRDLEVISNPMADFDLADGAKFETELEERTTPIDYVFNSHKKRKHLMMNKLIEISKIPKPSHDLQIRYSKYKDFSTKIPKYYN